VSDLRSGAAIVRDEFRVNQKVVSFLFTERDETAFRKKLAPQTTRQSRKEIELGE